MSRGQRCYYIYYTPHSSYLHSSSDIRSGFMHVRESTTIMARDQLISIIALLVAGVWAIVALISLLLKDYTGLSIVTPVMVIVAGFLFGFKKNGNGNGGTK